MERIRERLLRAAAALEQARVLYAVAGGNAVAAWVSLLDRLSGELRSRMQLLFDTPEG